MSEKIEEQDVQDTNVVEDVQVNETVEGQDTDSHGHDDHTSEDQDGQDDSAGAPDGAVDDEQDTFDRSYVEKLRKESAKYREKAKRTEELEHRLHAALVAADGRLADPTDLEFAPEHLDDPEALQQAVTNLVKAKPGLRAQQVRGDVGAGDRGTPKAPTTDLLTIMQGL